MRNETLKRLGLFTTGVAIVAACVLMTRAQNTNSTGTTPLGPGANGATNASPPGQISSPTPTIPGLVVPNNVGQANYYTNLPLTGVGTTNAQSWVSIAAQSSISLTNANPTNGGWTLPSVAIPAPPGGVGLEFLVAQAPGNAGSLTQQVVLNGVITVDGTNWNSGGALGTNTPTSNSTPFSVTASLNGSNWFRYYTNFPAPLLDSGCRFAITNIQNNCTGAVLFGYTNSTATNPGVRLTHAYIYQPWNNTQ